MTSRRRFLSQAASGAALLGMTDLDWLSRLPRVSAQEVQADPKRVMLHPEIEPLVRLIEDTPRDKLLEVVGQRIRGGTTYREVLAALQLAGVRNVQPRPSVGFKFHAVLVVNSAHLASLNSPEGDRWLPIFWALDNFKESQAKDVSEGDWTMAPVDESAVPPASKAHQAFIDAMDRWDEAAADAAVAALARNASVQEVFELFYRYGARDFRSIGHKAIFVSNSRRALETIGWQHAEPILRSLAYALLMHEKGNPAQRDETADRPGRENAELAAKIRPEWLDGKPSADGTRDMLAAVREGSYQDTTGTVVELLNAGVAVQSIWDGLFAAAGELLMRQPGIVGLHTLTTTNALHYAFQSAADDKTRRWLLLQNAAFLPLFRGAMEGRGKVGNARIDQLEPEGQPAVDEIFAEVDRNRGDAARKALAWLDKHQDAGPLLSAARVLIFRKGRDAHDYKFSSAVLEDYYAVSPEWRNRFLAAGMFNLKGSRASDSGLVEKTRAALSA